MNLLFVTLSGLGHLTPTLPLVEELVRRGHRVSYATGFEYSSGPIDAGAEWVELPSLPDFVLRPDEEPMGQWFAHYFAAIRDTYPVLLEQCSRDRPDVICYDATNWAARIVAQQLDIPAVRTVPHFVSNEHFRLMSPDLARSIEDDVAEFAASHGIELDVASTMDTPEACSIVLVPRAFQPHGDTFDETYHFIGPLLGRRTTEQWQPKHADLPLLYVSLGSIMSDEAFYRACVDGFSDGAWQVALSARYDGAVPDTFDVQPWFPQVAVLRHAGVFITHGGMNSTLEALHEGVPLVVVPLTPEQGVNADRVQELGLGERVDDFADLRAAVDRVAASEEIRRNLDRMRLEILAGGGSGYAADLVLSRAPREA